MAGLRATRAAQTTTPSRPNVLFVFSDEHRVQSAPGEVVAPNIARLASEGVAFSQCVSNYPVCSPYRAMLLSGRWPYSTGVVDNGLPLPHEETSLAKPFRQTGYTTGYVGKWHLEGHEGAFQPPGPLRHGFDYWRP